MEHSPGATLHRAVTAWLETCRSANTRAAYQTDIDHFSAWCVDSEVNPFELHAGDLPRYRADCETAGAGAATMARRLAAISSFGDHAAGAGTGDPPPSVARPTVSARSNATLLTDADADAMLRAADELNARSGVLIRLLMLDGLKVGETLRADATDVSGRTPHMTLALDHPARTISLHPETANALHVYLARRRSGPLVLSERRAREPGRLTRFGVDFIVKQVARAAGLDRTVSGNSLRRRYVIAAHEHGVDLDQIRRNAGHADERTTRRYLRSPVDLRGG